MNTHSVRILFNTHRVIPRCYMHCYRHKNSSGSGRSSSTGKKKVRSISELVKLVISGEVKVPQSLTHYVGDCHQLLDQVFAILSDSDVKGMLPDILKARTSISPPLPLKWNPFVLQGLRMKQVKQLCLDQLKNMSQEDITEVLDPKSSIKPINLDAAVFELLDPQTEGNRPSDMLSARTIGTDSSAHPSSSSVGVGRERTAEDTQLSGRDDENLIRMEGGESGRTSPVTKAKEKEDLRVSEVSENESEPQTMECDTTTEELNDEQHASQRHRRLPSDSDESDDSSSLSELEDCWLCDFPEEVPEWARLQEIEFRRRALEAELRRADQAEGEGGRVTSEHCSGVDQEAGKDTGPLQDAGKIDKLGALELQMRQRALQSLLAKKKEHKL